MNGFDQFVSNLPDQTVTSVRTATTKFAGLRRSTLPGLFSDVDAARQHAARVKDYVLDNLRDLLVQFESQCRENGINVHWASDAEQARKIVTKICLESAKPGATIVKAKSMAPYLSIWSKPPGPTGGN